MNTQETDIIDQGARIAAVYSHIDETSSNCRAFDIMLAADALIYALDRGRGLERDNLQVSALLKQVEEFRHTLAEI
ncbi:hypothetical protein [Magnetovibrio sp.]|uniref:hypothetical protein n=1 Tax=Magnetovibrio sp. TaxID=2024836 RepID=UPI002F936AE4